MCALRRYVTVMCYASALQCVMVMVTVVRYGALRWCVTMECYNDELRCVKAGPYAASRWYVTVLIGGVLWRCVMVHVDVSVSHSDHTRVGHCHHHRHQQRRFYQPCTPCGPRGCK